ncbi:response regulator transcription factor [Desertivirga arenae]|uniref:response regulator transcription factor n=1 Tax=Desertivirga arenae TaxID=2810309 RepID=UPI001A95B5ED|nr:response regulator transcription factor [Pedobacter sp. SYSU D00823]
MKNILILEDDLKMASELKLFLNNNGFDTKVLNDGGELLSMDLKDFSLYLLDINVPTVNGIEVCKKIRETNSLSPILMLTAYSAVHHKVQALNFGADDYLVKPFHLDELLARVKALLRRSSRAVREEEDIIYKVDDLAVNVTEMKVQRGSKVIELTPKEYKLLELLAKARGRTVSKQVISEEVWDINFETGTNTIEVYINFLRTKIDKGFETKLIHTRPGYGYYLKKI